MEYFKIGSTTLHRWTKEYQILKSIPVGGRRYYKKDDVKKLLNILRTLVDEGNTVIGIEHNLDVIKTADHIIDLGPKGGNKGGNIIFQGIPEDIIKSKKSFTGMYLKNYI